MLLEKVLMERGLSVLTMSIDFSVNATSNRLKFSFRIERENKHLVHKNI